MSFLENYISDVNKTKKALSVFLTAGYPDKDKFVELALSVFDSGADIIEIGIPFSDPLADGPTIQASSQIALENGINMDYVLNVTKQISSKTDKPVVLMGYANPILNYGTKKFFDDAKSAGAKGIIIPDVPLEEYDSLIPNGLTGFDIILLTTPASPDERISTIANKSSGFVYCVSVTGTTGTRTEFADEVYENIERTYNLMNGKKMLVGFGISKPEDVEKMKKYCDGVIVGSAVIKSLQQNENFEQTLKLISELNSAT